MPRKWSYKAHAEQNPIDYEEEMDITKNVHSMIVYVQRCWYNRIVLVSSITHTVGGWTEDQQKIATT